MSKNNNYLYLSYKKIQWYQCSRALLPRFYSGSISKNVTNVAIAMVCDHAILQIYSGTISKNESSYSSHTAQT